MKDKLEVVVKELLADRVSAGRRVKKLDGTDNLYSVRLSKKDRFIFDLDEYTGIAIPISVGGHKVAYGKAIKHHRRRRLNLKDRVRNSTDD